MTSPRDGLFFTLNPEGEIFGPAHTSKKLAERELERVGGDPRLVVWVHVDGWDRLEVVVPAVPTDQVAVASAAGTKFAHWFEATGHRGFALYSRAADGIAELREID